jgi:hypothetical protein
MREKPRPHPRAGGKCVFSKGYGAGAPGGKEAGPRDADLLFERLYRSSRDDVYAYVAGLLREPAAAEQVTATAFERAYRKRSRFDPRRREPRAWLFVILRRRAHFSHVSLRIESGSGPASSGGSWGVGGAFHEAGHVLSSAAGVALIGLAVLGPRPCWPCSPGSAAGPGCAAPAPARSASPRPSRAVAG